VSRALVLALACAALPLLSGVAVFVAWVYTRANWLASAGVVVMGVGVVLFLVGIGALIRHLRVARHAPDAPHRPRMLAVVLIGGLLFVNFPAAAVLTYLVIAIESSYTVVVCNQTGCELTDVRVEGGGCSADFGSIASGDSGRRVFWVRHDGRLEITAREGADTRSKIIDEYVTNSLGGHTTVTLHPDGAIAIVRRE
jgi:hypothetical protein